MFIFLNNQLHFQVKRNNDGIPIIYEIAIEEKFWKAELLLAGVPLYVRTNGNKS